MPDPTTTTASTTAKRLDDLRWSEISGVDMPAHLVNGWLVLKALNKEAQTVPEINLDALDPEIREHIETVTAERDEAVAKAAALEAEAAETTPDPDSPETVDPDEVLKSLPEPVRKMVTEARERAEAAEAIAKAEQDRRLTAEFVAKAAELDSLSVDPDKFGSLLRKAAEALGSEAVDLFDVLKAANDAVATANLLAEVGTSSAVPTGNAYARLEALAKAKTEASPGKSMAEALTEAATEHPDLYTQHLTETRKGA